MKKILHIIDSLGVGGAEKLLVSIVNSLDGYQHHIIYLSFPDTLEYELRKDARLVNLNFSTKWDTPGCIWKIRKYIKKNDISIVHSHLVMSNILARLATPKDVKLFNSLHNLNGEKIYNTGKTWKRFLEKWTYKKRHHLIAVSAEVLKDYESSIGLKGRVTVLHNFVEERFFVDQSQKSKFGDTLKIVAIGSLKEQKNYFFLVEAFRRLPPSIQLDIYGDGPLFQAIQDKVTEYGVNIKLCGTVRNIEEILPQYDLYVMSSLYEGHPIALLEAMASGLPALVSDIPVLREATTDQGLYFNLQEPEDFIRKIMAIANHEVDLDQYAANNLQYAQAIGKKQRYLERLCKLYDNQNLDL